MEFRLAQMFSFVPTRGLLPLVRGCEPDHAAGLPRACSRGCPALGVVWEHRSVRLCQAGRRAAWQLAASALPSLSSSEPSFVRTGILPRELVA